VFGIVAMLAAGVGVILASTMLAVAELGHLALSLALVASFAQMLMPILPLGSVRLRLSLNLQFMTTALVLMSFGALIHGFVTSDFSIALVAEHSHSLKPMIYKIAGTWGNHEGSLLLWVVILVGFGGVFAASSGKLPQRFTLTTLAVQAFITLAFLAFSLFTSNPFERLDAPPLDGRGLNPVLQDIGLALHPPMLYLGYVGLSKTFALAVAGLITGRIDQDWGRWVRPWILSAWAALTVGIALGSWWAYYELGWGGWWFWDPVENASLMPWLVATALMHSVLVVEKRDRLKNWAVLLSILAFSLSLAGTFIVRSGLLTSVHSFASDPSRGVFILSILAAAVGVPLVLFAWRAPQLRSPQDSALISRDTSLVINNIILVVATAVVIIGTFYPLALELITAARITVGPPYFAASFNPVMALGLIGMVIGPMLVWRQGVMPQAKYVVMAAAVAAVLCAGLASIIGREISASGLAGLGLLGWLAVGMLTDIQSRLKFHQPRALAMRIKTLGLAPWGVWLGHLGVAVFLLGAMGEGLGHEEVVIRAKPGQVIELNDRNYRFLGITEGQGSNYTSLTARLQLEDKFGHVLAVMTPEKRYYPNENQTTTEAAIRPHPAGDDYAVLGDGDDEWGYSFRLYHKPLVSWVWGGAALMAIGGMVSFAARRRLTLDAKTSASSGEAR
jgi:cytochrome c-type biogenesis protein CcmF